MFESLYGWVDLALGLNVDAQKLNIWQMGLRAVVIYITAFIMVRIAGDRRFIGKYAAIDVVLGIILGSTLSRAINGTSAFFLQSERVWFWWQYIGCLLLRLSIFLIWRS